MKKTHAMRFKVKDPDGFGELCYSLGISEEDAARYLEYGEYGTIEVVFDEDLRIVSGRLVPVTRRA